MPDDRDENIWHWAYGIFNLAYRYTTVKPKRKTFFFNTTTAVNRRPSRISILFSSRSTFSPELLNGSYYRVLPSSRCSVDDPSLHPKHYFPLSTNFGTRESTRTTRKSTQTRHEIPNPQSVSDWCEYRTEGKIVKSCGVVVVVEKNVCGENVLECVTFIHGDEFHVKSVSCIARLSFDLD